MILFINEQGDLQLTEKALMIKTFKVLHDHVKKQYGASTVISVFSFLHLMYDYDSPYFRNEPDEEERIKLVRQNVLKGKDFRMGSILQEAMALYKTLYDEELVSLYLIVRQNVFQLKDYASKMSLSPTVPSKEDMDLGATITPATDPVEFAKITTLLRKQFDELEDFDNKLKSYTKNQVNAFGGKTRGAYE